MDQALVLNWETRSKRVRGPPPKRYFDEFVATDSWYVKEMLADVPPEELHAALEDETWETGSDGVESEGEDGDYSETSEEEDDANSDSESRTSSCPAADGSTSDTDGAHQDDASDAEGV
jgi:hypothetical protein